MAGIFKAYDVRGLYPGQLNEELARRIGMAFERLVTLEGDQGAALPRAVVVSRDMRDHSVPLSAALCDGLTAAGLDVLDIGLATTPMNYFATGRLGTAGGIQVTASHNAAEYNGLKFSLAGAVPVSGDHGIPIIEEHALGPEPAPSASPGRVETTSIEAEYAEHVLSFLDRSSEAGDGPKLRLAADAANGMGTIYRPLLLACGVELLPLYFELDGTFPNHEANPLLPENLRDLSQLVVEQEADIGVSFDGDGDRAAFVDEHGEPIGSDLITAVIAGQMLEREPGGAVIHDIRSSRAVPEYIRERGGTPLPERVGHSFVKATMRRTGAIFGGELAGHYYFRQNYCADSSILAVVAVLAAAVLAAPMLRRQLDSGRGRRPQPDPPLRQVPLRDHRAAAPLREEQRDQLRSRGQGRDDGGPRRTLRRGARRHARPPRRHPHRLRRLVVQRPALEHRAPAAARPGSIDPRRTRHSPSRADGAARRPDLARILHRRPTATADPLAVARRVIRVPAGRAHGLVRGWRRTRHPGSPSRRLDVVSATPAPPLSPSATLQRRLHALATDLG